MENAPSTHPPRGFTKLRAWAKKYDPTFSALAETHPELAGQIRGPLVPGSEHQDLSENTDMIDLDHRTVSLRVRSWENVSKYAGCSPENVYRVAIRTKNPPSSSNPTDLEKILAGYGDLLFFGISCGGLQCDHGEACSHLAWWGLADFKRFREQHQALTVSPEYPNQIEDEPNGWWFKLYDVSPCLLASAPMLDPHELAEDHRTRMTQRDRWLKDHAARSWHKLMSPPR